MRQPKVPTERLIDLLAAGNTIPEICVITNSKKFTIERRLEGLRAKHNCKNTIALVVKLKLDGVNTSKEQTNIE